MKTMVLTGGGTAGHIYPLLAVKERVEKEYNFVYIGGSGMEKEIVRKKKILASIKFQLSNLLAVLPLKSSYTLQTFFLQSKRQKNCCDK